MFIELASALSHAASHLFDWFSASGGAHLDGLSAGQDHLWTFAYGANMGSAKLQTLGVHPTETLKAALPRHELIFDRSLTDGYSEPAFANIRYIHGAYDPSSVAPVQGVVHAVTPQELEKLDLSESPLYHRVQMPVFTNTDHGHERVMAWTYVGNDDTLGPVGTGKAAHMPLGRAEEGAPSERYAELVVCGAKERGLAEWYTKRLERALDLLGLQHSHFTCQKLQPHATTALAATQSSMGHAAASAFLFLEPKDSRQIGRAHV